jgi:hypothetical protein
MKHELSWIPFFGQYAELRTKVARAWRALPRPERSAAAKLCLLPDVERAFSETHRQSQQVFFLGGVPNLSYAENSTRHGGSKASPGRHQFAARLPDKWIGSALGSDFCRRAMAGKNGDVVAEWK